MAGNETPEYRQIGGFSSKGNLNLIDSVIKEMGNSSFRNVGGLESFATTQDQLNAVLGGESFAAGGVGKNFVTGMSDTQRFAMASSINTMRDVVKIPIDSQSYEALKHQAGLEGFSNIMDPGETTKMKAISIGLNAQGHRQTNAAEAMFKSIIMGYSEEIITYNVRAAGLGSYVYGANAFERASQLKPLTAILRDVDFFLNDVLAVWPVYSQDTTNPFRKYFVAEAVHPAWDQSYDAGDSYKRKTHKTNYLKVPATIHNFLGLMQTPTQELFDMTDMIESNSIKMQSLLVEVETDKGKKVLKLNTGTMSNNFVAPTTTGQDSNDRSMSFVIRELSVKALTNIDDSETDLFDTLLANDAKPVFDLAVTLNFNRSDNRLTSQTGTVEISYITVKDVKHNQGTEDTAVQAQFAAFKTASVVGMLTSQNVENTNRSHFGYRIEIYDANKNLGVRRQTPISVKYPVEKRDTNNSALDDAVKEMGKLVSIQMSASAFREAKLHFEALTKISGAEIVGNTASSATLAGQHFIQATAMYRKKKLRDLVSTQNNVESMENTAVALCNTLGEMAAAMLTNSGLASIYEYDNKTTSDWTLIMHQNLHRYLFRQGDVRTLGAGQNVDIEICNYDSMIGKFYLIPKSRTTGDQIDPVGGIGVNLTKENVVITANMTRDNKDFGLIMTQPFFQQHPINCLMGVFELEDAADALHDAGLIDKLVYQRIKGAVDVTKDGEEPIIPKP